MKIVIKATDIDVQFDGTISDLTVMLGAIRDMKVPKDFKDLWDAMKSKSQPSENP